MTIPRSARRSQNLPARRRSSDRAGTPGDAVLALLAAKDLEGLIDAAFRVLQGAVAADFVSAFYRSSSKGTLEERDSRGRRYSPAFMRRYMELNPAIPLALASRGVKILPTRTGLPRAAELRTLPFYREVMQEQGWRHAVALCFWGDPPAGLPIFVTSVYRTEGRRDFSTAEIARLEGIHPFIDSAVTRLRDRATATSAWDSLALTVRAGASGFAVLDSQLRLVEANGAARRLCATWVDDRSPRQRGAPGAWRLPPLLEQACIELRGEWQSRLQVDPDAAVLRRRSGIPHPRLRDVSASISIVCRNADGLSEPSFVLELERLSKSDPQASVLTTLTTAERVVAMALMDGRSNQEIADHLAKSVAAVKFLLHRVYKKTGVASRAALVAALRD